MVIIGYLQSYSCINLFPDCLWVEQFLTEILVISNDHRAWVSVDIDPLTVVYICVHEWATNTYAAITEILQQEAAPWGTRYKQILLFLI